MSPRPIEHATVTVDRRFRAAPARVFAAWADAAQRRQWFYTGDEAWDIAELQQDFRVGGKETARFGPRGDARYRHEGWFLDIVPDRRIVSAGSMHDGTVRSSSTLYTIDVRPDGKGTHLVLTDQSIYYGTFEEPSDRRRGWGEIVGRLERFLAPHPPKEERS